MARRDVNPTSDPRTAGRTQPVSHPEIDEQSARIERYAKQQETVAVLAQVAIESSDLHELLRHFVQGLAGTLHIDLVEVLELQPDGKTLHHRAGYSWTDGLIGQTKADSTAQTQAGFTLLADEPVVVTDLLREKRFQPDKGLLEQGVVSGITVAIGGRVRPYGVLGVYSRKLRAFAAGDVYFLRSVANLLATAVRGFEADQARRDSAERVRAIVNTLVDGIITIDARGIIESINPAAERTFGYPAPELIGRNVSMIMPRPYQDEHDTYLHNYLTTGKAHIIGIGREVIGQRKDGSTFPMDLAVSELNISGRRMFIGVVRDITERRRMEREILEAGAAEQRRIGQDLHDGLCQHLAGIAFAAEVLSQKLSARKAPEAPNIRKIGEMVDQAITQARDLARGLQPVTLDASGLLSALSALAQRIEEIFHISCCFTSEGACEIDDNNVATHLFRIAQEAISNAIKHGKAHQIAVHLADTADSLTLSVWDDGVGFRRGEQPSIGMGLRTMDYRARVIGGILRVQPDGAGGTSVVCAVRNKPASRNTNQGQNHGEEKDNGGRAGRKAKNQNPRRR